VCVCVKVPVFVVFAPACLYCNRRSKSDSGHSRERLSGHTRRHLNFWRPFSILLGELSWARANKKPQPGALSRKATHKYRNGHWSKCCMRVTKSQATSSDTFLFTRSESHSHHGVVRLPSWPSTNSSSKSPFKDPCSSPRTPVSLTSPLALQH